ncbi:MAG: hypothetical protein ABIX10_16075 [Acidimicrobiales bacterium]
MGLLHRKRQDEDKDHVADDVTDQPTEAVAVPPAPPPLVEPDRTVALDRSGRPDADGSGDRDVTATSTSPTMAAEAPVVDPTREHVRPEAPAAVVAPTATQAVAYDDRDTVSRDHDRARSTGDPVDADDTTPVKIREQTSVFAPGQLVSLIAGGALVVVGAIALVRAGLEDPLGAPVVEVLGWTHTAWLGLGEIGLGVVLMLLGIGAWGRWLSVLVGAAAVVAGVIVLVESDGLPEELGLERDYGWALIGLGAIVALAAMALPVWRTTNTTVRTLDLRDDEQSRKFWSRR